jgi:hypothetical protein
MRVFVVEELGMKLDPKKWPLGVLHRLDWAGLIGSSASEAFGEFLHFVEV